ncbi:protein of unknown function [Modicisalibacter muralis]|uniref:DUF4385 domain-containing protein n=1 Tax=Modicisalibacter muralis TaxID=119000 RepID=A0A1G9J189_9GAMM|nr:protein of unknown function [Halomonas muralis]
MSGDTLHDEMTDYRRHPERYRIGRGEQGVLKVEPYKSELLPHWSFKTPEAARKSADTLYAMFGGYKAEESVGSSAYQTCRSLMPSDSNSSRRSDDSSTSQNSSSCGGATVVPASIACTCPRWWVW